MSIGNPLGQSTLGSRMSPGNETRFIGMIPLEIAAGLRFRWQNGSDPC
jgi:hypothetical protein